MARCALNDHADVLYPDWQSVDFNEGSLELACCVLDAVVCTAAAQHVWAVRTPNLILVQAACLWADKAQQCFQSIDMTVAEAQVGSPALGAF